MTNRYVPALLIGAALSACQPTTISSTGQPTGRAGNGGEARSEVQIIDGSAFTATWRDRASTEVRLTFDSTVAMSDAELLDVAQIITGCTGAGAMTEPTLVGSIATVRIPMVCGSTLVADAAL
jgi:hypothetical protein